jgi:hypothetical protein
MTRAQVATADWLLADTPADQIVDLREIGSEGVVLRTIVPGPLRGPGTWLIARNGVAQSYDDGRIVNPWEEA